MTELTSALTTYGPIVTSIGSFVYLLMVKINNITAIEKTLDKMDKNIEAKLDTICERQLDHEGRISTIEGQLNAGTGRH